MTTWNPKCYFDRDRTVLAPESELRRDNLPEEVVTAMRKGEVFTLIDKEGKRFSRILMDSYDTIREQI